MEVLSMKVLSMKVLSIEVPSKLVIGMRQMTCFVSFCTSNSKFFKLKILRLKTFEWELFWPQIKLQIKDWRSLITQWLLSTTARFAFAICDSERIWTLITSLPIGWWPFLFRSKDLKFKFLNFWVSKAFWIQWVVCLNVFDWSHIDIQKTNKNAFE